MTRKPAARTAPSAASGRCYGYARVSTIHQADEGQSLDVQQRVIAGYAQMHGLAIVKVFVERGVSGSRPLGDRPQGAALLAALKPGDIVITPKLDRMFRSALDALDVLGKLQKASVSLHMIDLGGDTTGNGVSKLVFTILSAVAEAERDRTRERKAGVSLHMIDLGGDTTGNGVSKLVFTILSAVAEAERDRTREHIAEAKRDQRRRGRHLGGSLPFGYTKDEDGNLQMIPGKRAIICQMVKWRDEGLSLRKIWAKVTASGEHQLSVVALVRTIKRERERVGGAA